MNAKTALIADLKKVAESNDGQVTRNFYRESGNFSEKAWQKMFPKFEDFCAAAGVNKEGIQSTVEGNIWSVFVPSTVAYTPDELIKQLGIDTQTWELDRFRAKDITKEDGPEFQVSAFFRKRKHILDILDEIADMKTLAIKGLKRKITNIEYPKKVSGNMLEINISDHHFGKLAWPKETGHEPYDVQIAKAMFMRALNTLIERSTNYKYDQVLFVVGNDLLNSDNAENTTTKGTVVTTDVRYHKTFRTVRYALIEAIEKLKLLAPVKVLVVPGNHDQLAAWHMGDSLEAWYHDDKNVIVENQPRYRKYHQFGQVLLGFTHGDKGCDYPLLMATEEPKAWAETKFREIHTGHRHTDKVTEDHGVKVRILSSLAPADDWHAENGYVSNQRTAEAFIWNKEQGLIGTVLYNDDAFPTLLTKRELV
jgi:hypothetical protein